MARDLHPMPSQHLHMSWLKTQLELAGDVVMQQFASSGHDETMLGPVLQSREEAAPQGVRLFRVRAVRHQLG